jgi:hypothetical protein
MHFSSSSSSTDHRVMRVVIFQGHPLEKDSRLVTKLYANYETISKLHEGECSMRTVDNLHNLHIVRGQLNEKNQLILSTSMSGPHHYFGFLDPKKRYRLQFDVTDGFPMFEPEDSTSDMVQSLSSASVYPSLILSQKEFEWIAHNQPSHLDSLFSNPGTFWCSHKNLDIPTLSLSQTLNLHLFNAELVPQSKSFLFQQDQISKFEAAQHKLRLVTYFFGSNYYQDYCLKNNGVFLEHHDFLQFITPMNQNCGGFIILGRRVEDGSLELIQITIPFGFILLLNPGAIHGDSTLVGLYLMGMTGNHVAMNTANTVFLRHPDGYVTLNQSEHSFMDSTSLMLTHSTYSLEDLKRAYKSFESQLLKNVYKSHFLQYWIWRPIIINIGTYWTKVYTFL